MSNKPTFNIKDKDGNSRLISLKDKLLCSFADGRNLLMGETDEGTFVIHLVNPKDSVRYPHQSVHLTEGSLMAFFATMNVYFRHKGINPSELHKKYLPEEFNGSIPCSFEVFGENTESEQS